MKINVPTPAVDLTRPGAIGSNTPGSGAFTTVSASGVITAQNGTAAAPAINFGDANTGIYRNSANGLGFSTNGILNLSIASTGAVSFQGNSISGNNLSAPARFWLIART